MSRKSSMKTVRHAAPKGTVSQLGVVRTLVCSSCPLGLDCPGNGDCDSCYVKYYSHFS